MTTLLTGAAQRALARADALMNRVYGWRYNPLYHSGALAVALLAVVVITGVYLLFFYRIGSPYASVERITAQVWTGRWIRSLHRYASDAAVVAAAIHAFRIFAQRRVWGPRALAWITGLVLVFVVFVCGWTGYVMVWDVQGIVLAQEGARILDALPLFSEPIQRAFVGDREIPSAFFFLNLFLHVALPVGIGLFLWIHVSRVARPALLPPRLLTWTSLTLLSVLSVAWPIAMAPAANLFRLPDRAVYDVFFSFWIPLTQAVPAGAVWAGSAIIGVAIVAVPWWPGIRDGERQQPSVVNQRLCDGCKQCYLDCPYEAITMIERADGRVGLVSQVDPTLCVSCGICAGSCAPMGVGPPHRTGREQLATVKDFLVDRELHRDDVVLVTCNRGAGGVGQLETFEGARILRVDCAGSMHTSVVEYLVRSGVGGVLIVSCPPRDCWSREGPKWLGERLYKDREAELKPRVDRRRVRVVYAGLGERYAVKDALREYRRELQGLGKVSKEAGIQLDLECDALSGVPR